MPFCFCFLFLYRLFTVFGSLQAATQDENDLRVPITFFPSLFFYRCSLQNVSCSRTLLTQRGRPQPCVLVLTSPLCTYSFLIHSSSPMSPLLYKIQTYSTGSGHVAAYMRPPSSSSRVGRGAVFIAYSARVQSEVFLFLFYLYAVFLSWRPSCGTAVHAVSANLSRFPVRPPCSGRHSLARSIYLCYAVMTLTLSPS